MRTSLLKTLSLAVFAIAIANPAHGAGLTTLLEGFNDINTLSANGWAFQNNSNPTPLVTTATANWKQGNTAAVTAQAGGAASYIYTASDSTAGNPQTGIGDINSWLITPELDFSQGGLFVFYTRTILSDSSTFAHYLEVRESTNGASTNVGSTASDVGDFTILKATIGNLDGVLNNPYGRYPGDYPGTAVNAWQGFAFYVTPTSGSGRLAFRSYFPNSGQGSNQQGFIGVDTVSFGFNLIPLPPGVIVVPEPSSALGLLTLGGFGFIVSRRGKSKNALR
jgi:hypothetical protein